VDLNVAIIGSGFGGLATAVRLREQGVTNFAIYEKADDVGGTWRANQYPGCRCDVASNLYSLSFAPNPNWTNSFSYQPEIWAYLRGVADKYHLRELIKFNHEVEDIRFDESLQRWQIVTNHGTDTARTVVLATGGLAEPRLPEIDGFNLFTGSIMHTAQWDHDLDLTNKRVAIIGTGASAVQVIPQIAPKVSSLTVFQRTPTWVLPHLGHPVKERTKRLYKLLPFTQRLNRAWTYWRREILAIGFVKEPRRMAQGEEMARKYLAHQVTNPELRAKLTPDYRMGCKRITISNDYLPTFNRDNVTLVTEGIDRIEPTGIRTRDGVVHECDIIICATGFYVTDNPMATRVHGADGESLAKAFVGRYPNYLGSAFPRFPNFFMLGGPNTALGHSSIVFMHESQLRYIVKAIKVALSKNALVEPRRAAADAWVEELQKKLPATVWGTGCQSWYLNASGENTTVWPDFTFKFRQRAKHFEAADHQILLIK
jgi:cation diffusion facilitator CzcD-associated flavoprotein CzcO